MPKAAYDHADNEDGYIPEGILWRVRTTQATIRTSPSAVLAFKYCFTSLLDESQVPTLDEDRALNIWYDWQSDKWIENASDPRHWMYGRDLQLMFDFALRRPLLPENDFQEWMEDIGVNASLKTLNELTQSSNDRHRRVLHDIEIAISTSEAVLWSAKPASNFPLETQSMQAIDWPLPEENLRKMRRATTSLRGDKCSMEGPGLSSVFTASAHHVDEEGNIIDSYQSPTRANSVSRRPTILPNKLQVKTLSIQGEEDDGIKTVLVQGETIIDTPTTPRLSYAFLNVDTSSLPSPTECKYAVLGSTRLPDQDLYDLNRLSVSAENGFTQDLWGLTMTTKEAREKALELNLPCDYVEQKIRSYHPRRHSVKFV